MRIEISSTIIISMTVAILAQAVCAFGLVSLASRIDNDSDNDKDNDNSDNDNVHADNDIDNDVHANNEN